MLWVIRSIVKNVSLSPTQKEVLENYSAWALCCFRHKDVTDLLDFYKI